MARKHLFSNSVLTFSSPALNQVFPPRLNSSGPNTQPCQNLNWNVKVSRFAHTPKACGNAHYWHSIPSLQSSEANFTTICSDRGCLIAALTLACFCAPLETTRRSSLVVGSRDATVRKGQPSLRGGSSFSIIFHNIEDATLRWDQRDIYCASLGVFQSGRWNLFDFSFPF